MSLPRTATSISRASTPALDHDLAVVGEGGVERRARAPRPTSPCDGDARAEVRRLHEDRQAELVEDPRLRGRRPAARSTRYSTCGSPARAKSAFIIALSMRRGRGRDARAHVGDARPARRGPAPCRPRRRCRAAPGRRRPAARAPRASASRRSRPPSPGTGARNTGSPPAGRGSRPSCRSQPPRLVDEDGQRRRGGRRAPPPPTRPSAGSPRARPSARRREAPPGAARSWTRVYTRSPMSGFSFAVEARDGRARAGRLTTPHGEVRDARLHAGGHRRRREGRSPPRPARDRARGSCSRTPTT